MKILKRVACPHCWHNFPPEKILWVSEHNDLLGDTKLGEDSQQRFLPTRFSVMGEAIDSRGFPCHNLACPKCHLIIPRPLLEMEPLFFSIFGAPASGKSYFLAAMTWELRRILPMYFNLSFSDADPSMNQVLDEYKDALFSNPNPDSLVPLSSLIRKTEEQGDMYDLVSYGSQTVSYPRPFLFCLKPELGHRNAEQTGRLGKTICLYDNAGESFQPGKDSTSSPVTRHMAHSRALFFVFDPTQDNRFREHIDLPTSNSISRTMRQEPILQEAAFRIRRYAGLGNSEKHSKPLIVILTKCDTWIHLLNEDTFPDAWVSITRSGSGDGDPESELNVLNLDSISRRSALCRQLLLQLCPEIVTAAESFASEVYYIPASAVGWDTEEDPESGMVGIRPSKAEPYWATVPFLFGLAKTSSGLISKAVKRTR